MAHGLGIKNTLDGSDTVRGSLKEHASALEEGKADILGLYMIQSLLEKGEISEGTLEDYYVTFMAGIFRSVRFGASSAHGKANMIRFNFFAQEGAFEQTEEGVYRVNVEKMGAAVAALSGTQQEAAQGTRPPLTVPVLPTAAGTLPVLFLLELSISLSPSLSRPPPSSHRIAIDPGRIIERCSSS